MVEPHLFVLEKASYTYKNTVIQKTGQPTHLAVICSVPLIPMARIIKRKPLRHNLLFHGVLCLERSERNGYKDEDFLKVQDNYANEILREGEIQHLHYMQYIVGVIINSKNEILYINPSNSFKTYLMYDGTSDYVECVNEYWKTIFDCNKSEWEPIGKAKIDNAIHNYFLYEFDETVCSLSTTLKFEWLNIESYLNRSNDIFLQKYLIGKLG